MTSPLRTALRGSRPLTILAAVMGGVALISAIGLLADDRMLGGQPIWLKPFKCTVSGGGEGETHTEAEIAARLHLGVTTVKTHVASLMAKTGCANRVQLAVCAARLGLR